MIVLSGPSGQTVTLGFRYWTDGAVAETGFGVDEIAITGQATDGAETDPGWTYAGFSRTSGSTTVSFFNAYFAEFRTYRGYDDGLRTGPYNFGFPDTAPNWVEHFPYQDGLLVWYWNARYTDNNVSTHPGGGEVLPIDARGTALKWSDGTVARNRIQAFDATFGLDRTDPISLHREVLPEGATDPSMTTVSVPSQPAVKVFDDTKGDRYYDAANPGGSAQVPDTGTQIKVVSTTKNGNMKIEVY